MESPLLRSARFAALGFALTLATTAFAQQVPATKPDLRYECDGQTRGKISFTIWSAQGICARDANGKTAVLNCTVSASAIDIPSKIGAERIDRASGKFNGIFGATNRPAPYGGMCKELKP